jgi:hypothetical protein
MGQLPSPRVQPTTAFHTRGWTILVQTYYDWEQPVAKNYKVLHRNICLFCREGYPHWSSYKSNYRSIFCYPVTFHSTSMENEDDVLRQWYQFSRSCKWTSWRLQDASIYVTDGNSPVLLGNWRMWLEIHPITWNSLWRIMGNSSEIYKVSSTTNIACSDCHLWGTVHTTHWDVSLSDLQNSVCPIWWSFQPKILVHWTLPNWWTTHPITCCWPHWRQM